MTDADLPSIDFTCEFIDSGVDGFSIGTVATLLAYSAAKRIPASVSWNEHVRNGHAIGIPIPCRRKLKRMLNQASADLRRANKLMGKKS